MAKAWLGIDWGTYSSKWCYRTDGSAPLIGTIWDSRVWRVDDRLAMFPLARRFSGGTRVETALKRTLIRDPGQPYWTGDRPRLGVSLGQAVVFSLFVLVLDAMKTAKAKGLPMRAPEELEVRFSHPNWMSQEDMVSLRYLRDAAVTAAVRVFDWPEHAQEDGGLQIAVSALREWAHEERSRSYDLTPVPEVFDYDGYPNWSKGATRGIRWRLVFESCAAGFSYLAEREPGVFDPDEAERPAQPRKLLVVDIGAGSTDSGYMLRTIAPKTNQPLLLWLPAAATFSRAGKWLTEKIRKDWEQRGRHATEGEVEDYKVSGASDWHERPYVKEWCQSIANHVARYMEFVPDNVRLHKSPPLEIALTGGSSTLMPVRDALLLEVTSALKRRGIGIAAATRLIEAHSGADGSAGYTEVERAQLAVSLGAAHPQMAELRHWAQGLQ